MPPKRRRGKAGSEADDSSGDEYGRPKKSVRRTAARGKGKKGGSFSKVPIDVLYEVGIWDYSLLSQPHRGSRPPDILPPTPEGSTPALVV